MEKQQQILQMAKDICRVKLNCNDVCNPVSACDALRYAERAVEAGYVKQSEAAREIFEEIEEYTASWCGDYLISIEKLDELKKKYTEGRDG